MLSATARDYLETIYNITMEGDAVVGARLAEKFGVSPASVAEMLRRLARDDYITVDRASGAVLTEQGVAEAEAGLRRHRLAERFLLEVLGMDWITAHEEAHALEHALTPRMAARMVAVLGNPTTCPHGNPIPGSAPQTRDFLRAHGAVRLSAAPLGVPLRVLCISEVVEDETALLRYVGQVGLRPQSALVVTGRDPAQSACVIQVQGRQAVLGHALAAKIWVAVQDEAASVDRPPEGTQTAPPSGGETEQRGQVGAALPSVHDAPLERAS
jgi:DtxR family transcriptional regulator, Mn-dependent transcriptional regulator